MNTMRTLQQIIRERPDSGHLASHSPLTELVQRGLVRLRDDKRWVPTVRGWLVAVLWGRP